MVLLFRVSEKVGVFLKDQADSLSNGRLGLPFQMRKIRFKYN